MNPQSYAMWQRLMAQLKQSAPAQFVGGARDMLLPEKLSDVVTGPAYAMRHPIESAKMLGGALQDASQSNFEKMFAAPSLVEKVGYGAAGAIPALGPVAAMAGEEFGAGNTARGLGMSAALLGPSMYGGAKAGARFGREAANEIMAARMELAKANAAPMPRVPLPDYAGTLPQKPLIGATPANLSSIIEKYGADTDRFAARTPSPAISHPPLPDPVPPALPPEPVPALLPTRRDALKAGGAVAAAAMVPKLLAPAGEAAKAAGVVDAPVLGRAAPSALGREGYYRDLKHRVSEMWDHNVPTVMLQESGGKPTGSVSALGRQYTGWVDGTVEPPFNKPRRLNDGGFGDMGPIDGERFFLSRAELDSPEGPVYGKQVFRMHPKEPLMQALKDYTEAMRNRDFAKGTFTAAESEKLPIRRIVHSEITPEAALRLNTIEKRAATSTVLGPKGRKARSATSIQDIKNPDAYEYFKVVDDDGAVARVVAIDKRHAAEDRWETVQEHVGSDLAKKGWLDDPSEIHERWGTNTDSITYEEAKAISSKKGSDFGGWAGERQETVGISPRYTKRVSIRLLKDTMAKQIAENKRAAGQKKASPPLPPKLLAKLEDAPPSRRQFFKGLDWDDWTKDKK